MANQSSQRSPHRQQPGKVYLVGAGPGNPDLLTRRAYDLIQSADVILYDKLISEAIITLFPPGADVMPVGRRSGDHEVHERIHPQVITSAEEGKMVVRLKQGDPLIFGRGGEEALALVDAGIPFEIVPGITAASGAAASLAIPLTQRGKSSDITFATAHPAKSGHENLVHWESLAQSGTLVLYMVAKNLRHNLERLVDAGKSPHTPCALITAATTPDETITTGTLATLADNVGHIKNTHAALVIIGPVVDTCHQVREKI